MMADNDTYKLILAKASNWYYKETLTVPSDITVVDLFNIAESIVEPNPFIVSVCNETKVITMKAYDDYVE